MSIGRSSRIGRTLPHPVPLPGWQWLAAAIVVGLLGLLAWAEVCWLPTQLPREFTAHTALVITAPSPGPDAGQLARALGLPAAGSRGQVEVVVPGATSGLDAPPPASIRVEVESRCIEFATAAGGRRGLLVTAVAKGDDQARLESGIAAWRESLAKRARLAQPSATVAPLGTVSAPYQFCAER